MPKVPDKDQNIRDETIKVSDKLTNNKLKLACDELALADPFLAITLEANGYPPLWSRPTGFATLALIILEQQVSLESARAVYRRLESLCQVVNVENVLSVGVEGLRSVGLTRQKAAYCTGLAQRITSGETSFRRIALANDQNAHDMLCELKGIGSWTANVYLVFALGRPDVWPPGDIALMRSIAEIYGLESLPDDERCLELAELWRPWRSVAARILWHSYLIKHDRGHL